MNDFNHIFINDVKSIKKENIELKIRVQQLENEMETIKQMLKTILIDDKKIRCEKALVIQNHWKIRIIKKNNIKNFYTQYIFFKKWRYNIELSLRRKNAQYITCTPINLSKGDPLSNYKKQIKKYDRLNCEMRWDDNASNNGIIGNLFAFVKSDGEMEIHWITKIGDETDRESYWSERKRNVVFLSKEYLMMTWNDYKERNKYKEGYFIPGTKRLRWL
tara:strand:+ start:184 stop:837 length:654 start_codon:yes stop_codon:yes gene_type:complete